MNNIGLSIVIPVYNVQDYIEQCIESILNQDINNIELLIINDGSTDNTLDKLKNYQDNKKIKVINQVNQGVSFSRNVGIDEVTKKYIMFIDGDDWLESDTLLHALNLIEKESADYLISSHKTISTLQTQERKIWGNKIKLFSKDSLEENIKIATLGQVDSKFNPSSIDSLTPVWSRIYKTSIIKDNNIRFIDLNLLPSECMQFNFDYCQKIKLAVYSPEILYNYRRNPEVSITKEYRENLLDKWIWWYNFFNKKYSIILGNDKYMYAFNYRIASSLIPLGGNMLKLSSLKDIFNESKVILNNEIISNALRKLSFDNYSLVWRLFFKTGKKKKYISYYVLTKSMRLLLAFKKK